jgi:hypothetical protein
MEQVMNQDLQDLDARLTEIQAYLRARGLPDDPTSPLVAFWLRSQSALPSDRQLIGTLPSRKAPARTPPPSPPS